VSPPVQFTEPTDNNFGTGTYFTFTNPHYEVFDAYDGITIQTVTVYSNQSGARTIELLDNAGNMINSSSQNIASGTQVVTLNFHVDAGNGYRLGLQDGSMSQLYRNATGANYPYIITGLLSITGNDIPDQDHYYYFYNWQVQKDPCRSLRVPALVTLLPKPNSSFDFVVDGQDVIFTNTSSGDATSYLWIFGDGSTSDESDPTHSFANNGFYSVELLACIGSCCDTFTQQVQIGTTGINNPDLNSSFIISPNPFDNYFQAIYSGSSSERVTIQVTNVLGEVLLTEETKLIANGQVMKIGTEDLPAGVYMIRAQANGWCRPSKPLRRNS